VDGRSVQRFFAGFFCGSAPYSLRKASAARKPFVIGAGLVAISAISSAHNAQLVTGKVGGDLDLAAGQQAAARAARNLLAVLLDAVDGDPSRIERLLMVRGYVNAADDFLSVHKVVYAASEVIIAALGDKGRHARTAIGCAARPNGNAVTFDAIAVLQSNPLAQGSIPDADAPLNPAVQ
jgi:enamine deaminase RidA (YjgF/YER057c/UK114 family)